jgi:hypothetical protein
MFKWSVDVEDAIAEFRRNAPSLVLTGNRCELKQLYARLTAAAGMKHGRGAAAEMRTVLVDVLLAPSRQADWDLFADL